MKKLFFVLFAAIAYTSVGAQVYTDPTTNNVGIGTTMPAAKLDVNGNGNYSGSLQINGYAVNSNTTKLFINNGNSGKNWALSSGANMMTEQGFHIYNWTDNPTGPFFSIINNGNVGVGIIYPVYKFVVSNAGANELEFDPTAASGAQTNLLSYNRSTNQYTPLTISAGSIALLQGNVGIGITTPPTVGNYGVLALNGRSPSQGGYLSLMANGVEVGSVVANSQFGFQTASGIVTQFYTGSTPTLQISSGGNVLINQTAQANTGYKLDVNGSIRSNAVVVNTSGADFVFNRNYHLNPLGDLERYIKENHHLPEIKSAEEMQKDGMNVGELNTKLLQKVEELTLYLIDKDKQVQQQQMQLGKQQQMNLLLQEEIDQLKKQLNGITQSLNKN